MPIRHEIVDEPAADVGNVHAVGAQPGSRAFKNQSF
jgi:hypothetical protein